jgi:hypothetical protein
VRQIDREPSIDPVVTRELFTRSITAEYRATFSSPAAGTTLTVNASARELHSEARMSPALASTEGLAPKGSLSSIQIEGRIFQN